MHQMHVPVFINSSQVIHKADTLCCYLVTHKADIQNFSYSYCRLVNWSAVSLQLLSLYLRVQAFLCARVTECTHMPMDQKRPKTWIPETHNYGIHYFPISGVAMSGVTPRSR